MTTALMRKSPLLVGISGTLLASGLVLVARGLLSWVEQRRAEQQEAEYQRWDNDWYSWWWYERRRRRRRDEESARY
jgi:hypothetical protein